MTSPLVLVIDDNADDAELTARALRRCDVANTVVIVHDGLDALASLTGDEPGQAHGGALPSLVLLDVKMPRVDGFEIARRLRAHPRTRFLPIVLLTSSGEERDIAEGYAAGVNGYVRKPIASEQFVAALQAVGRFWLGCNEVPSQAAGPTP